MNAAELTKELNSLTEGLALVRRLTQARVDEAGDAEGYEALLKKNRRRIEEQAVRNNDIIDRCLEPLFDRTDLLDDDLVPVLEDFCDSLLRSWPEEDLDLTLHYHVSRMLYKDALIRFRRAGGLTSDRERSASYSGDVTDYIIRQSGRFIASCYNNINRVNRIRIAREFPDHFQREGLEAAEIILGFLDHDHFALLGSPESRYTVLSNARFYLALYDTWYDTDESINEIRLNGLIHILETADDPWYVHQAPEYDFTYHKLRTYEHMGQLTENGNQWRMTPSQCSRIMSYMDDMKLLWEEDETLSDEILPRVHYELIIVRNEYYAGRIDVGCYRAELKRLYEKYAVPEYDMYSVMANIFIPSEFLATFDGDAPGEDDEEYLGRCYNRIAGYILYSAGTGSFSFMLEYLNIFMERFIEIPGRYSYEYMGLVCIAAFEPLTYIDSLRTGQVARLICSHVCHSSPGLLRGAGVYGSPVDVPGAGEGILHRIYHAGCCSAFGIIPVIDTFIGYGRRKMYPDEELTALIPDICGHMLSGRPQMKDIASIVAGGEDAGRDRILSDILMTARQIVYYYNAGYGVKEVLEDRIDNPDLADRILRRVDVREDIASALSKGNEDNLLSLWLLLKEVNKSALRDTDSVLEGFIRRTMRIRELSALKSDRIDDPADYAEFLRHNFKEIGLLAGENRNILSTMVYPLLNSDRLLTDSESGSLRKFCTELLNGQNLGDVDQSLVYRLSKRLLEDARAKDDANTLVKQLDIHISSCYEMMHQAKRMKTAVNLIRSYREEGLLAAEEIMRYLDRYRFARLSDEAKELVLINARYSIYLYETDYETQGVNELYLDRLSEAFRLAEDPFYRSEAPGYDWNYHLLRCMEYIGQSTECSNIRGFTREQCIRISGFMDQLEVLWAKAPVVNEEILPQANIRLLKSRNKYFGGLMEAEEYRKNLRDIFYGGRNGRYDFNSVFPNLQTPLELLLNFWEQKTLSEEEQKEVTDIYTWILGYLFRAENSEAFSLLLEYFSELLYHFIETDHGYSFEQMGLYYMAALHSPTYIHSLMVGEITRCLCSHLYEISPEQFEDMAGTESFEDIKNDADIIDYAYHAALCHDFGKLPMIDTIFVYGRSLLDSEFALLKHHPRVGTMLLEMHESTRPYADVARGHHRWYNDERGYPEDYNTAKSPVKIIIDIVSVADSIDAATDGVGRSYATSKSLDEVTEEIINEAGTRYSPYVADLLKSGAVRADIGRIL